MGMKEKVEVVSIEHELDRGEAQQAEALQGRTEVHGQRLNTEVIQEAGEGVSLPDPSPKGEGGAVTTINAHTGVTPGHQV